jgi:membrane protein
MKRLAVPEKAAALLQFIGVVSRRFDDDHCMQIASSLTFTTLLSLVPLATVALTLISAFPVFREMNEIFEQFVLDNLMPDSAEVIGNYTEQFRANAAKLTTAGIALLTATAVMLMVTIERAFNQIWRVRRTRPVLQRAIIYWTLLTVGPVLVGASISLTSWLVSVSLGLVSDIPGAGVVLLKTIPVVLTSLALALLYLTMPNRRIQLRDALIGGVLAGLVFEATKRGFGWYVSQFPSYKLVYGAFASVPVFLLWIYISWLIMVFGAVVVATLPEWRARSGWGTLAPGTDFVDAIRILKVLWEAHRKGAVVRLATLHAGVAVGVERIEALLEVMMAAAWVSRAAPDGWVLNRDPAAITLEQVYRLFVFSPEALAARCQVDAEIDRLTVELGARMGAHMQLSVEEFFRAGQPVAGGAEALQADTSSRNPPRP